MNDNTRLHDLLLFGTNLQGAERMEAINALAKLLKTSAEKVESMLKKKSIILLKGASIEVARRYEKKLIGLGFQCNTRPSNASGADLELVPMEKKLHTLSCPACGYVHKLKEGDDKPDVCESCNIVLSKYSQNLKLEREKIKRALLAKSEREEKAQQEEDQRREEEQRRKRLEEEILRELGLPRLVSRRSTLIGSASGIFAIGLVLGIAGLMAFNSLNNQQEDPDQLSAHLNEGGIDPNQQQNIGQVPGGPMTGIKNVQAGNLVQAGPQTQLLPDLPPETVASMDPSMVAHLQVAEMLDAQSELMDNAVSKVPTEVASEQLVNSEYTANRSATTVTDAAGLVVGAMPKVALSDFPSIRLPASEVKSSGKFTEITQSILLPKMLEDLENDHEWNDFILRQVYKMAVEGRTETALTFMGMIHDPRMLMEGGSKLAVWLAMEDRPSESDQVFEYLMKTSETLAGGNRVRVEALHSIARNQAVIPGKALDAEFTVMQARVIAESATGACEQAAISAEVATMLNLIGHEKAARQAYQHSNQGLSRIEGQMELLTCLGHMVSSYTKSGNRGGALMLLQDMTEGIETLKSRDERDTVKQNISRLYGKPEVLRFF